MSHLAEIRRWIAMDDYEAIGTFLDKNRDLDELDVQYLNQHVPQEKKETWNDFVDNGITMIVDTSQDLVDRERGIMVESGRSMGGVWSIDSWYDVRITVATFRPTPFGNKVPCSTNKNKTTWVGGYETFTRIVTDDETEHSLMMYHNQTFKFDI